MKARGSVLAPYELAAAQTRHAKKGTRQAEVSRYARAEITAIASGFNEDDADAGRPPMWEYIESLMASGTKYVDRQRRK